jgi:hypothetical protein
MLPRAATADFEIAGQAVPGSVSEIWLTWTRGDVALWVISGASEFAVRQKRAKGLDF